MLLAQSAGATALTSLSYRQFDSWGVVFARKITTIQAVTPSDMFSWPGPDAPITMQSERTGIENKWYALTGRVVELKVEEDGDLHIALHDVTGDKPGVVVCEVPAQPQWCEIRTTVFSWTPTPFALHTGTAKKLHLRSISYHYTYWESVLGCRPCS